MSKVKQHVFQKLPYLEPPCLKFCTVRRRQMTDKIAWGWFNVTTSMVSSVGRTPVRLEPQTGSTLRVSRLLWRMCCLCNYICQWLDVQIFSNKDYKPVVGSVSCILISVTWLVGDVKELTAHLTKRVEHVFPSVVVWPCLTGWCFTYG